jgi:myosin heavy subunit
MSDKRRYTFNKVSKFVAGYPSKGLDLPKYINSEEISNIITRGCKSTHNIKRFKHLESYTPSPSHDNRHQDRYLETPSKFDESHSRKNENLQKLAKKILELKEKNSNLKETIKDIESKYKGSNMILKRENEKLIQNIKSLKKEQNEEKSKYEQTIFQYKNDLKSMKNNLEKFIKQVHELIGSISSCPISVKEDFNKILLPYLPNLSQEISECVFNENIQFYSTGKFRNTTDFSGTIEISDECTKEAIVLKSYEPTVHGELQLKVGDRVVIIKTDDNLQWLGKIQDKIGLFPSSHVMLD